MYSSGVWSLVTGAGAMRFGLRIPRRGARLSGGRQFSPREIVAIALDLFLLAIHEIDVVAEVQVQILHARARQLHADRIELEQEIVSERADQGRGARRADVEIHPVACAAPRTPRVVCCAPLRETVGAAD
jgi:hypothetical protein